jgi:hypothetical protein
MIIRHATPARNVASIRRPGLLASRALGRLAAVWTHTPNRTAWAVLHVAKRHAARAESVLLEVSVFLLPKVKMFGPDDLIHRYTRAEALADGVLVEVSDGGRWASATRRRSAAPSGSAALPSRPASA